MNVPKELAHDMRCLATLVVQAMAATGCESAADILSSTVNLACIELRSIEADLEHIDGVLALRLEGVRKRLELAGEGSGLLGMIFASAETLDESYVAYRSEQANA